MAILFDFYNNPTLEPEQSKSYHPRVVTRHTVSSQEIERYIQDATSLTISDVRAALAALSQCVSNNLKDSHRVHLQGIGYFQVTLKAPKVSDPAAIHAQSVSIGSVRYKADSELNESMRRQAELRRATSQAMHSAPITDQEIMQRLNTYFADHQYLTSAGFRSIIPLARTTAYRRLNALVANHHLINVGTARRPIYQLNA